MVSQRKSHDENKRLLKKFLLNSRAHSRHIHLTGSSACGIIETLKTMESDTPEVRMVFVNCMSIEGCPKNLFSQIRKGFKLKHSKGDNIDSLQQDLNKFCEEKSTRLVCILLESHALNVFTSSFLKAFFDVARQTRNGQFSFVTVSHLPWMAFQRDANSCAAEPESLWFRVPTQEEMIETIRRQEDIPVQFIKICADHLIPTSNNPNIIKNLVREAWTNVNKTEWNKKSELEKYLSYLDDKKRRNRTEWLDSSSSLLSDASKLVLVASYCASHNHPASDKRYLIKSHNKEKVRPNQKVNESSGIPKMFDLERLLFIREALIQLYPDLKGNSIGIEPRLLVNSLVSMNRIILVSSKENLDWPKLKCVTPFETIRQLAQNIGITDIKIHLEY